ncbi:MAG: aromatic amino acid lyase [Planctomycetota bacterium]|jgi:histidine ammonia-lyase
MSKILNGKNLAIEDVVAVARHSEKVELAPEAVEAINRCRSMLERKIEAREVMYGIRARRRAGPRLPEVPHLQPCGGYR